MDLLRYFKAYFTSKLSTVGCLLAASLFLFSFPGLSSPEQCNRLLSETSELAAVLPLLRDLNKEEFEPRILQRTIEGKTQSLLILGETHAHSSQGKKQGQAIVKEFKNRAVEWKTGDMSQDPTNIVMRLSNWLQKHSVLGTPEGSTMDDAVLLMYKDAPKSNELKNFRFFPIDNERRKIVKIQSTYTPIAILGSLYSAIATLFFPQIPYSHIIYHSSLVALSLGAANYFWFLFDIKKAKTVVKNPKTKEWVKALFINYNYLISVRDEGMAKSIDEVFRKNSNINELLAVVGNSHVPGMANQLQRQGWTEFQIKDVSLEH